MTTHHVALDVPSVPYGTAGTRTTERDAKYYREAARNIRHQANRGNAFAGSNLTETVAQLCDAVAGALDAIAAPAPVDAALAEWNAVAEAIAQWDYLTANGGAPDSDESLILPHTSRSRRRSLASSEEAEALRSSSPTRPPELLERYVEHLEQWHRDGSFDWGIEIRSTETSAIVTYEERDREACERFIANQPLWYAHRAGETMRIVKRLAAGPWIAADIAPESAATDGEDGMARRLLAIFGGSLDRQIENIEYQRDRSTGLYRPEQHELFLRAREIRDREENTIG